MNVSNVRQEVLPVQEEDSNSVEFLGYFQGTPRQPQRPADVQQLQQHQQQSSIANQYESYWDDVTQSWQARLIGNHYQERLPTYEELFGQLPQYHYDWNTQQAYCDQNTLMPGFHAECCPIEPFRVLQPGDQVHNYNRRPVVFPSYNQTGHGTSSSNPNYSAQLLRSDDFVNSFVNSAYHPQPSSSKNNRQMPPGNAIQSVGDQTCPTNMMGVNSTKAKPKTGRGRKPNSDHKCKICLKLYRTQLELRQCMRTHAYQNRQCPTCHVIVKGSQKWLKHQKDHDKGFKCPSCVCSYPSKRQLNAHRMKKHPGEHTNTLKSYAGNFTVNSSFNGSAKIYSKTLQSKLTPESAIDSQTLEEMEGILGKELEELEQYKFQVFFRVFQTRTSDPQGTLPTERTLQSKSTMVNSRDHIRPLLEDSIISAANQLALNPDHGSQWVIRSVENIDIRIAEYQPHVGGCNGAKLPGKLANKKQISLVNFDTNDSMCFYWCLSAALFWTDKNNKFDGNLKNHLRYKDYYDQIQDKLKKAMSPLVSVEEIKRIEVKLDITINVYTCTSQGFVYALHVANRLKERNAFLLVYGNHYYWIPQLSSLLQNKTNHKLEWCHRCLVGKKQKKLLEEHLELCIQNKLQTVHYPKWEDRFFEFSDFHKMLRSPVALYADFESTLSREEATEKKLQRHIVNSWCLVAVDSTGKVIHKELGWGDAKSSDPKRRTPVGHFLQRLEELKTKFSPLLNPQVPMDTSNSEELELAFNTVENCHICEETLYQRYPLYDPSTNKYIATLCDKCSRDENPVWEFNSKAEYDTCMQETTCGQCFQQLPRPNVVRDHDHVTGKFRGPAHSDCNLKLQYKNNTVPVFFHNLKGYDGHFIIPELIDYHETTIIPENYTKYKAFCIRKHKHDLGYMFLDSMAFLNDKLEKLAKRHYDSGMEYNIMKQIFTVKENQVNCLDEKLQCHVNPDTFEKLKFKGGYPYDYIDSIQKLDEINPPPIEAFFSTLKGEPCEPDDYQNFLQMYGRLNCRNFRDYHINYLWRDVALLAEVFEAFRTLSLKEYKLDPAQFISLPGLSISAALLSSKKFFKRTSLHTYNRELQPDEQQIEVFTDSNLDEMADRAFRGGMSVIVKRMETFANPLENNNKSNVRKQMKYDDANNLYGSSMCKPLPYGNFKLYRPDGGEADLAEIRKWFGIANTMSPLPIDSLSGVETGALITCDIHYPPELHDLHNDLPFCLEHATMRQEDYGQFQRDLIRRTGAKGLNNPKLLATLRDKINYTLNITHLQLAIKHGLVLKNITKVMTFNQAPYLKDYVVGNNIRRAAAKNDFEKNFFKLMNNSVYGKFCENKRDRQKVSLVKNRSQFLKQSRKDQFTYFDIINEDLVVAGRIDEKVLLNKPKYAGGHILEGAKEIMYKTHYEVYKQHDLRVNPPNPRIYFPDGRIHDISQETDHYCCPEWGWNLLFHDTDSLCYSVTTQNLHKEIMEDPELVNALDLSNFPKSNLFETQPDSPLYEYAYMAHQLYLNRNKANDGALGKMKDELNGGAGLEFAGLRAKNYGFEYLDLATNLKSHLRHKGVQKTKHLNFDHIKQVALGVKDTHYVIQTNIRSDSKHRVYTQTEHKNALSALDTKRHIMPDGIHTLAPGHFRINYQPTNPLTKD